MLAQVTTQRVSLQEDTSLDLKALTQNNSDRLIKTNDEPKGFPNLTASNNSTVNKRHVRGNQEKQISDDLLNVQKQVN